MSLISLSLALTLVTGYAPQQAGSEPLAPELEARVQKLGHQLRCPMCQGLSIAASSSSAARAQMDKVRELVAQGKSDDEIYAYFVARYGEFALLSPKPEGLNLLVWLGPGLLLLAGLGVIVWFVKRGGAAPAASTAALNPAPPKAETAADPYLNAVRAELDR